jgi:hypothetical protein
VQVRSANAERLAYQLVMTHLLSLDYPSHPVPATIRARLARRHSARRGTVHLGSVAVVAVHERPWRKPGAIVDAAVPARIAYSHGGETYVSR